MRPFVSLLMIPLLVLGHGLCHSHSAIGGNGAGELSARPHFHLSHGHTHASQPAPPQGAGSGAQASATTSAEVLSLPADHDSDSLYLGDTTCSLNRMLLRKLEPTTAWDRLTTPCWQMRYGGASHLLNFHPPDWQRPLPIFLLIASLRL